MHGPGTLQEPKQSKKDQGDPDHDQDESPLGYVMGNAKRKRRATLPGTDRDRIPEKART